jgi:hypothetical protein
MFVDSSSAPLLEGIEHQRQKLGLDADAMIDELERDAIRRLIGRGDGNAAARAART